MLQVKSYTDKDEKDIGSVKTVLLWCDECRVDCYHDLSDKITDNCALAFDLDCPGCGCKKTLFFLRCTNPALAKDLNAELEVLRIKRKGEVADGNQNDGKISSRGIQTECCQEKVN